jgi:hypothetical protein
MKLRTVVFLLSASLAILDVFGDKYKIANDAVEGKVEVVNIPWHFEDGKINWLFNPTQKKKPFNPEWTWQLNRMYFWKALCEAYTETKDEKYAKAFASQLTSWLDQTGGIPPEKDYNKAGSPWRTIEEGLRLMTSWSYVWETFRSSPHFTKDLQDRFVASMRAQANHLMAHKTGNNWLLMEMNGVHSFACMFPHFPESEKLRKESSRIFSEAISAQVLEDGFHFELSPDYHSVYFSCASGLYFRAKKYGFEHELSQSFKDLIEKSAQTTLMMTTPGFTQPRFNDCFTMHLTNYMRHAVKIFPERKDFLWGFTQGEKGECPKNSDASFIMPYAGFAIMRTGWEKDAMYLAFDFGPLGKGHYHQDKLSFILFKGDEELVFDDGGGQYEHSSYRRYGVSGYDHNVMLVDSLAQMRKGPYVCKEPIKVDWESNRKFDRIKAVYDQGWGADMLKLAKHEREIFFDKSGFVKITDNALSVDGNEHNYELLFHVDTVKTEVSKNAREVIARLGGKWDLKLTVEEGGTITTLSAQTKPRLFGWYVGRNDKKLHPATTIIVKSPRVKNHKFVTRLEPIKSDL